MSPALLRCEQCGREGTRGFTTIPAGVYAHPTYGPIEYPAITVCTGKIACRRRWPHRAEEVYE